MPVILNASTSSGFIQTADTSGQLSLQSNGTTVLALASTGTTITGNESVSGNLLFNSGYGSAAIGYGCRAWVNFNGTGTVAIRASGNVTSITDNNTGNYTVNFTTAMPDVNYAAVCNTVSTSATNINYALGPLVTGTLPDSALSTYSTTAVQVLGRDSGGTARDATLVTVSVFR